MSETVRVHNLSELGGIWPWLCEGPFPCDIRKSKAGRSLSQNALFHRWCEDIAKFFVDNGKTHFATGAPIDKDSMKRNLKQTFLGTEPVEHVDLTTGEVDVREELRQTSRLDKGEMCHFMTLVDKWATEHGIPLPRPEESEYMELAREAGEAT
jgi:hypothetical protein